MCLIGICKGLNTVVNIISDVKKWNFEKEELEYSKGGNSRLANGLNECGSHV